MSIRFTEEIMFVCSIGKYKYQAWELQGMDIDEEEEDAEAERNLEPEPEEEEENEEVSISCDYSLFSFSKGGTISQY